MRARTGGRWCSRSTVRSAPPWGRSIGSAEVASAGCPPRTRLVEAGRSLGAVLDDLDGWAVAAGPGVKAVLLLAHHAWLSRRLLGALVPVRDGRWAELPQHVHRQFAQGRR